MATRAENQAYFDAQMRRRIRERRTIAGIVTSILASIEKSDQTLAEYLRIRLASIAGRPIPEIRDRLDAVLLEVTKRRRGALTEAQREIRKAMATLAVGQPAAEAQLLRDALGEVDREIAKVDRGELRELALETPFAVTPDRAGTLADVMTATRQSDSTGLRQAILSGLAAGEGLDALMRRLAGSRAKRFEDGVLASTRRSVAAAAEAALSHALETGTNVFWTLNSVVFDTVLRWTTMLDTRVCPTCRARGGKFTTPGGRPLPAGLPALQPRGARPPAHIRCRCRMVSFLPGEIPDEPSYGDWLADQSREVQEEALGKRKAALFRSGKVKVEGFVDREGNELTLEELNAG